VTAGSDIRCALRRVIECRARYVSLSLCLINDIINQSLKADLQIVFSPANQVRIVMLD